MGAIETVIGEIEGDKRIGRHETEGESTRERAGSPDGGDRSKKERIGENERGGSNPRRKGRTSEREVRVYVETLRLRGGGTRGKRTEKEQREAKRKEQRKEDRQRKRTRKGKAKQRRRTGGGRDKRGGKRGRRTKRDTHRGENATKKEQNEKMGRGGEERNRE